MGSVLVTGDIVLDYHIYEGRRKHYGDGVSPGVTMVPRAGGAALIHDLLEELLTSESATGWESHLAVEVPKATPVCSTIDTSQYAYAFWRPFPSDAPEDEQYWRVSEAMGFGGAQTEPPCESWRPAKGLPDEPNIIVLSDGGMGFRGTSHCWNELNFEAADWIVLKTASPLFEGKLWDELSGDKYVRKLIVVVSARELRKSTARISSGLSWEETIENLIRDLQENLKPLLRCRHLLVAFESEGGVWIDFTAASDDWKGDVHFVYDPPSIEGDHAQNIPGTAFGYLSCVAAAAVWQLTLDSTRPNLAAALEGGLSAMRDLREQGHGSAAGKPEGFPAKRLAQVIKLPKHCYSIATFSCDAPFGGERTTNGDWSILLESRKPLTPKPTNPLGDLARLVVLNGPIALANLPQLKIGNLLTVDRREIESLRTISQIVRNYRDHDSGKKPLSMGVFGPPGSGKSFAVKELAERLVGKAGWREFNLSQFNSADDLIGAFHQIRDLVLQKLLPVAFFDEFDSQNFRWLQYLLAPMQDGKFQEGQLTHPLGKCILIFAGGTSWTFETLGPPTPPVSECETNEFQQTKSYDEFRLAKGPDFKSRLDGYLNVIGPNRRKVSPPTTGSKSEDIQWVAGHGFVDDGHDVHFRIRRALMIRHGLGCGIDHKLEIDEGVLHALLHAPSYKHGSRSLEKILQPLKSAIPDPIHRSSLAPRGQLDIHTNADDFIDLFSERPKQPEPGPMTPKDIETIAPKIHETWNELGLQKGWLKAAEVLTFKKLFEAPDEDEKARRLYIVESNRAAAERMPKILALVGLTIRDGAVNEVELQSVRQQIEYHLELLAEAEHDGWMRWHHEQGWHRGKEKDKIKMLHPGLIPYRNLDDENKTKDRTQIRHYPVFAAEAGKKIAFK